MTDEARAEFQRRMADPDAGQRVPTPTEIFVAGAEWADAQREPLTEATREQLRILITQAVINVPVGVSLREEDDLGDYLAEMILAEFRPVVSTREGLVAAIADAYEQKQWHYQGIASAILASGAVEDRAEVEAKALDDASWAHIRDTSSPADVRDMLRARAARLREGRS